MTFAAKVSAAHLSEESDYVEKSLDSWMMVAMITLSHHTDILSYLPRKVECEIKAVKTHSISGNLSILHKIILALNRLERI